MKKYLYWFPRSRAQQLVMFMNILAKIAAYETILPISRAKKDRIILICETFIALYNYVEQTRATAGQLSDFQQMIETAEGGIEGDPAPPPPTFQTLTLPPEAFIGIFKEFQDLVEDIKAADNYTRGIGEDLMIVAPEGEDLNLNEVEAELKSVSPTTGYKVRLEGNLQGFGAMKVEYRKKDSNIPQTFFLQKLPAEITIAPSVANEPESGELRCILMDKNEEVGQWSPNYPVTVST